MPHVDHNGVYWAPLYIAPPSQGTFTPGAARCPCPCQAEGGTHFSWILLGAQWEIPREGAVCIAPRSVPKHSPRGRSWAQPAGIAFHGALPALFIERWEQMNPNPTLAALQSMAISCYSLRADLQLMARACRTSSSLSANCCQSSKSFCKAVDCIKQWYYPI